MSLSYRTWSTNFQGWLGDSLLTTHPCFIVTVELTQDLLDLGLTGVAFQDGVVSRDDQFRELYTDVVLPAFVRLLPQGTVELDAQKRVLAVSGHDFSLVAEGARLVVSQRAIDALQIHCLDQCRIEPLNWAQSS